MMMPDDLFKPPAWPKLQRHSAPDNAELFCMINDLRERDNAILVRMINELKDLVESIRKGDVEEHDGMQEEHNGLQNDVAKLEDRLRKIEESKTEQREKDNAAISRAFDGLRVAVESIRKELDELKLLYGDPGAKRPEGVIYGIGDTHA